MKTHKEFHAEQMKNWRYRFWWYLLWPKFALIRLYMKFRGIFSSFDFWDNEIDSYYDDL